MAVTLGLLTYDIADDRRRTAVRKLLLQFGLPVQESVFVLSLSKREWRELKRRMLKLVNRVQDDVRVWMLCLNCQERSSVWCGVKKEPARPVEIV